MKGNYETAKRLLEANPKTTREEVMEACGCGELQAAAFMQRFAAEQHFSKHPNELFEGRYKGEAEPKHRRVPKPKKGQQKG